MSSSEMGESTRVRTIGDMAVVSVQARNLDDVCPRLSAVFGGLLEAERTDIVLDLGSVTMTGNRGPRRDRVA